MTYLFQSHTALAEGCLFTFAPSGTFSAGTTPRCVAVADFNGDGRRDLVVANQFSANVTVRLGNGDGTFQSPVSYAAGQGPMSVAVGDFNGDNRIDLAVANSSTADVSVLLGNGNGTFQAAVNYLAGTGPASVAVRDLNGDGRLDLAVANRASADVSILFGNGNGTFQTATSELAGVDPVFVAAGDFNNDTRSDLAVANAALFDVPPSVSVILGKQPNGTFQPAADYDAGISPRGVAIADFNKDGRPDLAVANYGEIAGTSTTNSSVPILLGQGDGTFSSGVQNTAGAGPIAVVAADFNGDTNLDLVVANERANSVSMLFGNGNGTFQAANNFNAGSHPVSLATGDFNGDGKPDVAVVNDAGVLVLLNSCQVGGDLGLTMTDVPDPVTVGNNLLYTLTVTNTGPTPSLDVSVTNRLPPAVSFVSAVSSQGSFAINGSVLTFSLGVISNGASVTISITTTAITAGPATNSANVVSATTPDSTPGNNTASVVTTVRSVIGIVATDPNASETGPDSGFITISRNGGTVGSLTVGYTVGGSAANGVDYSVLSGSATIPNGAPSTTFAISPINDTAVEPTETVVLTLNTSPSYVVDSSANSASVSILDDDVPSLSISDAVVTEGNAGSANAFFTVTLSPSFPQTVTVNYATVNGTATAGSDYTSSSGVLTFAPGTTSQSVSVAILGDTLSEADETFFVNLSNPGNATIADGQGMGTINSDDAQPVLTINDAAVLEGNSGTTNAIFTVTMSPVSGQTVTVNFATANGTASAGSDYVTTNGTLSFAPGITTLTIPVRVNGETNIESGETFFVNLTAPVNATVSDSQGVGTIVSDDGALSISNVTLAEGNSGTTNAIFTVTLSTALSQTVTVNYATANGTATDGSDYVANSGTLTFTPGTTIQTVTVTVLGDVINEPNETFFVNLSGPSNATLADSQGLGTIVNDDGSPALAINDSSVTEGNAGTVNMVFTVSLSAASGQTVTVNYATANGTASSTTDYVATNGVLSFAPGTTIQTLAVAVRGDTNIEPNETFSVNLSGAANATLADNQGVGTIVNDDATTLLNISDVTVTEGNSGTINAVFTVSLSTALAQTVTVNYATANSTATAGSDYAAASGLLTFPPGITNQPVTVSVLGDTLSEGNETFFVNLSNATNAAIADGQGVGTIVNDDGQPSLTINDVTVTEGSSGTVNAIFTVSLSPVSGQTVTVNFATADGTAIAGSDYAATNGTLTFAPGATSLSMTVRVNGDALIEPNETFFVNLSGAVNAGISDSQGVGTISNDDAPLPAISINDVAVAERNTGTTNAVFTVSLSATYPQPVTVNFATANGSAAAGSDYTATNGVLTFAPGTTSQSFAVTVFGDTLSEPNETFFVNLSNPNNATIADNQGVGSINNDEPEPALSINSAAVVEGNSGTTNAVFTVTLSPASAQTVTVNFATADGTATAGSDYVATSGSLTFAPGVTSQTIPVAVNGDLIDEPDESFFINLTIALNAAIATGQGLGTIVSDDAPLPGLSINDVTLAEGNSGTANANFTVSLSFASTKTVTVNYATANGTAAAGSDYLGTNGTVTFAPGTTSQSITIAVLGDTVNEPNEGFFVNLSGAANATITRSQGAGTINNDDTLPAISIGDRTVAEGNSATTDALFTVTLSAVSSQTVTVNYATANGTAIAGTDYIAANGTLTFAPGTTSQTVAISVIGDLVNEANDTFVVNLSGPANATISDGQGVGTINNDDPAPSISITGVSVFEGNSGDTPMVFTVRLSVASAQAVTVNYATANGTAKGNDFANTSGTLQFSPGQTQQTITVLISGDTQAEDNETLFVNLSGPVNATLADSQALGIILNDEGIPSISIADASVAEGNGGTTNAVFTLRLSAAYNQTVTVGYFTADGTATADADYLATNGVVNFAPGATSQTLVVRLLGDRMFEPNETFFVNLDGSTNGIVSDNQALGSIVNDDPIPALSINDVSVNEGNAGTGSVTFTVQLSAASGQPVTANFTTANGTAFAGSDYSSANGTVTFPPGTTNQTITVTVLGDALNEADETFLVSLSGQTNATISDAQGVGTILNDDPLPALSINDVSVSEGNGGTLQMTFAVSLSAPSGRAVTVDFATSDGTATAGADYLAAGGSVTFAPGSTSQTVVVSVLGDLLNEANESFSVNLGNAVNAAFNDSQGQGTILNDDPLPALAINNVAVAEGDSGSANAVFTVTLSPVSGQTVTVNFATANGTATAGSDYVPANGTLSFPPGTTTRTLSVAVLGDVLDEPNETLFVNLSGAVNATVNAAQGAGTINDDDIAPGLSISDVTLSEGNAGSSQASFTVSLSPASGQPVTVNYATGNGSATGGSDYATTSGTLTFNPGTTSQTITVSVLGDAINEADETFFVNLSNPVNAAVSDSQGTGTILNDDPLPGLTISDVAVAEGNSGTTTAAFTVTLSPASGQTVTVNFATADSSAMAGSDYAATNNLLTFAPGTTTQTIAVRVNGDAVYEGNELFFVNLSAPVNAVINDGLALGTINNDDGAPTLSINDVSVVEGDSGATTAVFAVSLSGATEQTVSVSYQTADGTAAANTDYQGTNGSLVFPPGTTVQFVTVSIAGDQLNEADETFFVNLAFAFNATFSKSQGRGTIFNDDAAPAISISDATVIEGNSVATDAVFTVSLSPASGQTVTVNYATAAGTATAGSDYVSTNGVLTFAAGTTTRTIVVKVVGDPMDETDESYFVNLSGAANASITDSQGIGSIINDDPLPGLSIGNVTVAEGNAGTTNAMLTLSLSPASGRTVSVSYATANGTAIAGSDYVATNGVVTFAPGTTAQTVSVRVIGDTLNESNKTFFVNVSNPVNAFLNGTQGAATIANDDPVPGITISNVTLAEGNSGSINALFTVSLSAASGQAVSVSYATANGAASAGSDYVATNGLVTFAPGTTSQNIAVAVLGDISFETNETFFVNLSNPINATISDSQGIATINNDDAAPVVTINDVAQFEGNAGTVNAVFTVSLSAASSQAVTLNYTTADGTARRQDNDYERIANTQLQFSPGQTNQTITVIVDSDTSVETNETFFVNLSSPVNATLARNQALGTILNDDGVPSLSISDVTVAEGHTGTTNALFAVRLSATSAQLVTVNYSTAGGSALVGTDYLATNGLVSFAAGTTNQTIAVRILGDRLTETNKSFLVNLSGSINALIGDGSAVATILDDDPLNFVLSTNAITVVEGDTNSFNVRMVSALTSNVTVTVVRTSGSTNLNVLTGASLTFTPANWNVFQPVVIRSAPDTDTNNETALFTVSNGGSAQLVAVTGLDRNAVEVRVVGVELTGGDVVIRFTTAPNRSYRVERTDDLGVNPWTAVGGTVSGTGGVMPVTDIAGAGQSRRFYRVVMLAL